MRQAARDTLNKDAPNFINTFLEKHPKSLENLSQDLEDNITSISVAISASDHYSENMGKSGVATGVVVKAHGSIILWFTVQPYPHCCAMNQINGFGYNQSVSEKFIHQMMAALQKWLLASTSLRWVFNFVESRRDFTNPVDPHKEVVPVENEPCMQFEYLFNWAKEQAKFQEMLFVNQNTGNIIHFCEVVFK